MVVSMTQIAPLGQHRTEGLPQTEVFSDSGERQSRLPKSAQFPRACQRIHNLAIFQGQRFG